VTENEIFIFCFINMSDDSFNFKSFTIDIILSSLKKIFTFLVLNLINIKVIDMTFIDKSLMSELYERFDIQSILLSKSKLIWLYDETFDWKLIIYTLYTLIMIQEYKNKMISLLITCLNQHKIIIENLWLKRNQILIDFTNDWLILLLKIIIIIINSYTLVTLIKSTHERLYAICIEWTKLSEVENHSQSTRLLHAVETVSFETMYQICSRWLHVRERVF